MKNLFLISVLFCSACAKNVFTTAIDKNGAITSGSLDNIQVQEISSGGGYTLADDNSFSVQTAIGSVLYSPVISGGDVIAQFGLLDILKDEFNVLDSQNTASF